MTVKNQHHFLSYSKEASGSFLPWKEGIAIFMLFILLSYLFEDLCSLHYFRIKDWPIPTLPNEVHRFHGLASFYRQFVKDFSTIAKPLTQIVKKDVGFVQREAQDLAFQKLKEKLSTTPLLILPIFLRLLKSNVMLLVLV